MNKASFFWSKYSWIVIATLLLAMFLAFILGSNLPLIVQTLAILIWIAIGISLEWLELCLGGLFRAKNSKQFYSSVIGSLPYSIGLLIVGFSVYFIIKTAIIGQSIDELTLREQGTVIVWGAYLIFCIAPMVFLLVTILLRYFGGKK